MPRAALLALAVAVSLNAADFRHDVQPVFAKRCLGCHGPGQQMAGLRLDDPASLLTKQLVLPGKAATSPLIDRVTSPKKGYQMPPMGDRLTPAELAAIRTWIDEGAKLDPVVTSAAPSAARSQHWAFQPVRRPATPEVRRRDWVRNPVDAFVLARLEAENIEPSPEATKATLLRRVSLDLTGLPPTPEELRDFLADNRPDAYERTVDRLLASPHYGEKWARPWLDLARYADSDGYEKDLVRPWAWRYRTWVIDALNKDLPYDQFMREQLAGDLLPNATVEQKIATGFHRNVLTNREAGVDRTEARFEQNINRTNTISTVFLGLTAGCAQCHNHKYDPISQRDYYALFAYANNLEENDIDAPMPGEIGPYLRARPEYDKQREALLKEYDIPKWQAQYEVRLKQSVDKPGEDLEWDFQVTEFKAGTDIALKLLAIPMDKRNTRQARIMTTRFLRIIGPDFNRDKELTAKLKECREKLAKLDATLPPITQSMAIAEDGMPPRMYIAQGGDYKTKGPDVDAAVPAFLSAKPVRTRLEFANWLASSENPLTARVAVNRMWQEFFGRGIVRTSEDFGTQGDKPTHPELLDWMATEFRETGWSTKRMHRLIVTSAAYRQSSKARPELSTKDPENTLLARQSRTRLTAELIRDSALAAAGLLNTKIGGPSVRPPQPAGVAELGYANSVKWNESEGADKYRRGLYIHFQRTTPYPMLMTFDAPDSNVACTRRSRSNTPLQSLNLLNDPVFLEAAQALAYRVLRESHGDRAEYAFQLALGRSPSAREKERLVAYLDQQSSIAAKDAKSASLLMPMVPEGATKTEAAAWAGVSRVLLNLDEFLTRE
ncbi:MAG: PSD1 and planctomycete cytochrome C domain-containing protein [Bryobacteraceae bacterium]|nr:PSD1 and planctomycete cytochrome C domain-containing protein [Bryobacteraceae bacterium]